MSFMSDGRNLEPWSQEMSKIERMVSFELIDELPKYKISGAVGGRRWRLKSEPHAPPV